MSKLEWSLVCGGSMNLLVPSDSELVNTRKMISKKVRITKEKVRLYGRIHKVGFLEDGRKIFIHWTNTPNKAVSIENIHSHLNLSQV